MSCCSHCEGADDFFSRRMARGELRRYRKKGPRRTTRMLLEALRAHDVREMTLLDVGGGVGAIQHELFGDGVSRAAQVDASSAYLQASRSEAQRRETADRVEYHHGDFVEMAPRVAAADIVTLDRVICCYPDVQHLVEASVEKARRLYGVVYPRERWANRALLGAGNLYFRVRGSAFRAYVHPGSVVDALVRRHGFRRASCARTLLWQVVVYVRDGDASEPRS